MVTSQLIMMLARDVHGDITMGNDCYVYIMTSQYIMLLL